MARPTFAPGIQTPGGGQRSHVQNLVPPRPQTPSQHLGAYTDGEPPAMDEATKALQTIAKTLTSKDEAVNHEKGKVSSIGKVEERLVYLVRGCDALTVSVGAAVVGKELFYSLRATATQGRPQLRSIQFPVNIGNRVAFGLASMSIGGRDVRSIPEYALAASDFPLTTEEDFDSFGGATDTKMEKRGKAPATLSHWYRNALRQAWAIACVYGAEHYASWEEAAGFLLRLGEDHGLCMATPRHLQCMGRVVGEICGRDERARPQLASRDEGRRTVFRKDPIFRHLTQLRRGSVAFLSKDFLPRRRERVLQSDVVPRHNRMLSRACWQRR